ncbi:PucR family transcriptional regulator [Klenkia marina]|uniref:PucR family transcriptional regulator n=1 Tax=Klenkia marina TaxID=1960309 RepID=UPI000B80828B|nr:PucR family transcriptional regulator [Klenkia marina]
MLPTVAEVLALPSVAAAAPRVLAGDPERTVVRWVHSSEVYEMGGLLSGGEFLLTTGLGLHGRSPRQLVDYTDRLADAGCVGLALELGRTFLEVPDELVRTAARRGLVLIELTAVAPFARMVENFHDLVVAARDPGHRPAEAVWQELLALVVTGQGLSAVLDAVARLAGCPVHVADPAGRVVAASRVPAPPDVPGECTGADVRGPQGLAGRLVLHGRPTRARVGVADRAAVAVALELGRAPAAAVRPSPAQSLVSDLVAGVRLSPAQVRTRLTEAGLPPAAGAEVLVLGVLVDRRTPPEDVVAAVHAAGDAALGRCLVAVGRRLVVVVARTRRGGARSAAQRLRAALDEGRAADAVLLVAAADPVVDDGGLGEALAQARSVVELAHRVGVRRPVVLAGDLAVHQLLAEAVPADRLAAFVDSRLRPVLDHDSAHGTELLRTLDAHLTHGLVKARTAAALGIRRQSLHARLDRLTTLLGAPVEDPAQLVGLAVALVGWQLRTGTDAQAGPVRTR